MEKSEPGLGDFSDLNEPASNPHMPWKQLVTEFQEGGLTPAQYASFALGGVFALLLIIAIIVAIHAARRAHAIEAEAENAAIGRWKDTERDIVKTLPEPPVRRQRLQSKGVMGHIRRYSEDGRAKRQRQRSASRDMGKGRFI